MLTECNNEPLNLVFVSVLEPVMDFVLTKYVHFLSIFSLISILVVQHLMLKPTMSAAELRKLAKIDIMYGASAGLILITGLVLWFLVGKDADFYTSNPVFHVKFTLFVLVGLLSIYPSSFFAQKRTDDNAQFAVPKQVLVIVRAELLFASLLPLLAVLMANGYGLN